MFSDKPPTVTTTPFAISDVCDTCKHLRSQAFHNCAAFPDGIPMEIWNGRNDHRQPFAGDNGIQYEPKES
jgi:hypothetical protein